LIPFFFLPFPCIVSRSVRGDLIVSMGPSRPAFPVYFSGSGAQVKGASRFGRFVPFLSLFFNTPKSPSAFPPQYGSRSLLRQSVGRYLVDFWSPSSLSSCDFIQRHYKVCPLSPPSWQFITLASSFVSHFLTCLELGCQGEFCLLSFMDVVFRF